MERPSRKKKNYIFFDSNNIPFHHFSAALFGAVENEDTFYGKNEEMKMSVRRKNVMSSYFNENFMLMAMTIKFLKLLIAAS